MILTLEGVLFIVVGFITILTAGLMLASNNAVHSALFLIVNFMGVALLYLMLEAPFLAMVQIAVYAGAIMVLFLFVIMLLGAEKTGSSTHLRRFRWLPGVAVVLALAFMGAVGWALSNGEIDMQAPPAADAQVRFVHAAPIPPSAAETALPRDRVFVLMVNGEVVDESFVSGESSDLVSVASGTATISLREAADGQDLVTTTLELSAGSIQTAVLAGEEAITFYSVPQSETAGLTIFNAYPALPSLALGDLKGELFNDARRILSVGADDVPFGTYTQPLAYPADFPNWVAYQADRISNTSLIPDPASLGAVVLRLSERLPQMRYQENALVIIGAERLPDGNLGTTATRFEPVDVEGFGSPIRIGMTLFTDYVLPFQLVALLLLAAMVGVIVITYRGEHVPKPSRETRRKVARPLTSVIISQTGTDLADNVPQLPERAEQPSGD